MPDVGRKVNGPEQKPKATDWDVQNGGLANPIFHNREATFHNDPLAKPKARMKDSLPSNSPNERLERDLPIERVLMDLLPWPEKRGHPEAMRLVKEIKVGDRGLGVWWRSSDSFLHQPLKRDPYPTPCTIHCPRIDAGVW